MELEAVYAAEVLVKDIQKYKKEYIDFRRKFNAAMKDMISEYGNVGRINVEELNI